MCYSISTCVSGVTPPVDKSNPTYQRVIFKRFLQDGSTDLAVINIDALECPTYRIDRMSTTTPQLINKRLAPIPD